MKLVLSSTALRTHGANEVVPGLGEFEWTVPARGYSRQDYLMLSYLLTVHYNDSATCRTLTRLAPNEDATHCTSPDLVDRWKTLASRLASKDFDTNLGTHYLCPVISSLTLTSSRADNSFDSKECTAARVRQWVDQLGQDRFNTDQSPQALLYTFPDEDRCVPLRAFEWSASHFQDAIEGVGGNLGWLKPTAHEGRAALRIEVPVRIEGEFGSRFVPVYWSVADVEQRFGVQIKELRRSADFLARQEPENKPALACIARQRPSGCAANACEPSPAPASTEPQTEGVGPCDGLIAPDRYFTIWFPGGSNSHGAKAILQVKKERAEELKSEMLIGLGDVLIVSDQRKAASDNPGVH